MFALDCLFFSNNLIAVLVEGFQCICQLGCPIEGQLFLLEAPTAAQETPIVEHVQAARFKCPVGAFELKRLKRSVS